MFKLGVICLLYIFVQNGQTYDLDVVDESLSPQQLNNVLQYLQGKLVLSCSQSAQRLKIGLNLEDIWNELNNIKDPDEFVATVNQLAKHKVLNLTDQTITINSQEIVDSLKEIGNLASKKTYGRNFLGQLAAKNTIDKFLDQHSTEIQEIASTYKFSTEIKRQKRDLGGLFLAAVTELFKIVTEGFLRIFQGPINLLVGPIKTLIDFSANLAINFLTFFYNIQGTNSLILSIIRHTLNLIIDRALDIIVPIQYYSNLLLGDLLNGQIGYWIELINKIFNWNNPNTRRKRDTADLLTEIQPTLDWLWENSIILLNSGLKLYTLAIFNTFGLIGAILEPIRQQIFWIIDTILCTTCV